MLTHTVLKYYMCQLIIISTKAAWQPRWKNDGGRWGIGDIVSSPWSPGRSWPQMQFGEFFSAKTLLVIQITILIISSAINCYQLTSLHLIWDYISSLGKTVRGSRAKWYCCPSCAEGTVPGNFPSHPCVQK